MTFKKGERVQTEDGQLGEILFVDKDGLEAQVALAHVSLKVRTETLTNVNSDSIVKPVVRPDAATARAPKKKKVPRTPQK